MASTVILNDDSVEWFLGGSSKCKLERSTANLKLFLGATEIMEFATGSIKFNNKNIMDVGTFFLPNSSKFYWMNTNGSDYIGLSGPSTDSGDAVFIIALPAAAPNAVGDIMEVASISGMTKQMGWASGGGYVKTTTDQGVAGVKTFSDEIILTDAGKGLKLTGGHATNYNLLGSASAFDQTKFMLPNAAGAVDDLLVVGSKIAFGGVTTYQIKYGAASTLVVTKAGDLADLSGDKTTSGVIKTTNNTNASGSVGAIVCTGGVNAGMSILSGSTIEGVTLKAPTVNWNGNDYKMPVAANTSANAVLRHSGSASGENLSWTVLSRAYGSTVAKVGASGNLNLSGTNQEVYWTNNTYGGAIIAGTESGAHIRVTTSGLYKVYAQIVLKANQDTERYGLLQFITSGAGEGAAPLLVCMQQYHWDNTTSASYVTCNLFGIVTLATGTDYVFRSKSESTGDLEVYNWGGANNYFLEGPLI